MKLRTLIFISVVLNILLAGAAGWHWRHGAQADPGSHRTTLIPQRTIRAATVTNAAKPVLVEVAAPFHWSEVESSDYRVYIQNLRAIGCPEKTIHDIIEADVNELFAGRVKEMVDGVTGRYWELMAKPTQLEALVDEKQHELEALESERTQVMEELFGANAKDELAQQKRDAASAANTAAQLDFLSPEKVTAIQAIEQRFQMAMAAYRRSNPKSPNTERKQKFDELLAQKKRDIQALLTPDEWEEYQLRTSPAVHMRMDLADLDITSEQMRDIVRAKMGSTNDAGVKELLGAAGYDAYKRASDDGYQFAAKLANRFGLPSDAAVQVYNMQREAMARASEVRDDANRTREERALLLQAMQAETERSLSGVLGPKAFKVYKKSGGDWLSHFADMQDETESGHDVIPPPD